MFKKHKLLVPLAEFLLVLLCVGCSSQSYKGNEHADYLMEAFPASETLYGQPIEETEDVTLLDITYSLSPDLGLEKILSATGTYYNRPNCPGYGLNQACPSISYVFPNKRAYDSFIDIHIREKHADTGENFSHLSWMVKDWPERAWSSMSAESYSDAEDFYKMNFSGAENGTDPEYSDFSRMDDAVISGLNAYHYSFERSISKQDEKDSREKANTVFERYGEQYLFETDKFIYVFAFSSQSADEAQLASFKNLVSSIQVNTDQTVGPPVWGEDKWFVHNALLLPKDRLVGDIPECLQTYIDS